MFGSIGFWMIWLIVLAAGFGALFNWKRNHRPHNSTEP